MTNWQVEHETIVGEIDRPRVHLSCFSEKLIRVALETGREVSEDETPRGRIASDGRRLSRGGVPGLLRARLLGIRERRLMHERVCVSRGLP